MIVSKETPVPKVNMCCSLHAGACHERLMDESKVGNRRQKLLEGRATDTVISMETPTPNIGYDY